METGRKRRVERSGRLLRRRWTPIFLPFLYAPVQQGSVSRVSEIIEGPPGTGSVEIRVFAVKNDATVVADSNRLERVLQLLDRREFIRKFVAVHHDLRQVQETCPRDVHPVILFAVGSHLENYDIRSPQA